MQDNESSKKPKFLRSKKDAFMLKKLHCVMQAVKE